jgi:hypothetical protein
MLNAPVEACPEARMEAGVVIRSDGWEVLQALILVLRVTATIVNITIFE